MGKFLALSGINANLTWENNSDRKQVFLLAMSAGAVVFWCRDGGMMAPLQVFQNLEGSGSINGGLQTLNLSLPLQFNSDMLQLFLALSFKISSVCVLPCHGSVSKVRVWIHWGVFPPAEVGCLIIPHLWIHTFYTSQRLMLLFAWGFLLIYSVSLWEVCPEGVIAGVRSLPVHQHKSICTSPGKGCQLGGRTSLSLG